MTITNYLASLLKRALPSYYLPTESMNGLRHFHPAAVKVEVGNMACSLPLSLSSPIFSTLHTVAAYLT